MTTNPTDPAPAPQNGPQTAPDAPEGDQGTPNPGKAPSGPETAPDDKGQDPDTFPAAVVKELRDENAKLRIKGKRSEALTTRLVHAMAAQSGRLADPTDLPVSDDLMDENGMPDTEKVQNAIEELLAKKPHLSSTRPKVSDVGQGPRPGTQKESLADILRAGA